MSYSELQLLTPNALKAINYTPFHMIEITNITAIVYRDNTATGRSPSMQKKMGSHSLTFRPKQVRTPEDAKHHKLSREGNF